MMIKSFNIRFLYIPCISVAEIPADNLRLNTGKGL